VGVLMKNYIIWIKCTDYEDDFTLTVASPVEPELHHLEPYVKWLGGKAFLKVSRRNNTAFQWISIDKVEKVKACGVRKT
jgi:hypothetical protein